MASKLKHVNIGISTDSGVYKAEERFKSISSKQNQVKLSARVVNLHLCDTKESILDHKNNIEIQLPRHETSGRKVVTVQ